MKKLITIFAAVILSASAFAQAPNKMSYQAVIRNNSNILVTNQAVGMQISILQGSSSGTAVYVETQTPTTNANGLASIEIGSGTIITGTFSAIDWANGPYFIKTETDPTGGSSYSITGTSQLLSVPYALYAANSGSSAPGPQGPQGDPGPQGPAGSYTAGSGISISGGTISNTAPNQIVTINGTGGTNVTGTYPNFTVSSPRIVAGTSSGGFAPTVITGSGFTVTRTSSGTYSVVFSTPFSVAPTVVGSVYNTNIGQIWLDEIVKISNVTTTGFTLRTAEGQSSPLNALDNIPFSFTAIGN